MKKSYGSGFAALLCISVLALVGCSAPSSLEQEPVAAPSKVTPKITITTEAPSENIAKPAAPTELTSTEVGPQQETMCQTDLDCVPIPDPPESCDPCHGQAGQRAVNRTTARQIMGPHRATCTDQNRQRGQRNSQHETCQMGNWANCVQGTCQLAQVDQQELQKRHQTVSGGQGGQQGGQQGGFGGQQGGFGGQQGGFGGQQGGFGGQQGGFGGQGGYSGNYAPQQPNFGMPQGYDRSGGAFPGANGNWAGGNSAWSNQGYPQGYGRQNTYPGMNPGFGGNFGSSAQSRWGNRAGWGRGASGVGTDAASANNIKWPYPEGYAPTGTQPNIGGAGSGLQTSGQPWANPAFGRQNTWPGMNQNVGTNPYGSRNLGAYNGMTPGLNNSYGSYPGRNPSLGNSYGAYPGAAGNSYGAYPGAGNSYGSYPGLNNRFGTNPGFGSGSFPGLNNSYGAYPGMSSRGGF